MLSLRNTFIDEAPKHAALTRSRSAPVAPPNRSVAEELFARDETYCRSLASKLSPPLDSTGDELQTSTEGDPGLQLMPGLSRESGSRRGFRHDESQDTEQSCSGDFLRSVSEFSAFYSVTSATSAESTADVGADSAASPDWACASSPGSLGHPLVCNRPCLYYAAGRCVNARDCGFCHLPHDECGGKLDKENRHRLSKMSPGDVLRLVTSLVRERAENEGFIRAAAEMLDVLEEQQRLLDNAYGPSRSPSNRLLRALDKLSFQKLLGVLYPRLDDQSRQTLMAAKGLLRARLHGIDDDAILDA